MTFFKYESISLWLNLQLAEGEQHLVEVYVPFNKISESRRAIKNGHSRATANNGHKSQNKDKQNKIHNTES
jgi:ribosomal protein L32